MKNKTSVRQLVETTWKLTRKAPVVFVAPVLVWLVPNLFRLSLNRFGVLEGAIGLGETILNLACYLLVFPFVVLSYEALLQGRNPKIKDTAISAIPMFSRMVAYTARIMLRAIAFVLPIIIVFNLLQFVDLLPRTIFVSFLMHLSIVAAYGYIISRFFLALPAIIFTKEKQKKIFVQSREQMQPYFRQVFYFNFGLLALVVIPSTAAVFFFRIGSANLPPILIVLGAIMFSAWAVFTAGMATVLYKQTA